MSTPDTFITPEELEFFREHFELSELEIILKSEWGSNEPTHRQKIREFVLGLADMEMKHNSDALSNLGEAPDLSTLSISISHCKGIGGFALTHRPAQIGLDLEESLRLQPSVVKRVCEDPIELEEAPEAAHLWVAKESAFKALLGAHQPVVISDIAVTGWKALEGLDHCYSFQAQPMGTNLSLNGVSFQKNDFHLGLAVFMKD